MLYRISDERNCKTYLNKLKFKHKYTDTPMINYIIKYLTIVSIQYVIQFKFTKIRRLF